MGPQAWVECIRTRLSSTFASILDDKSLTKEQCVTKLRKRFLKIGLLMSDNEAESIYDADRTYT